MIYTERFSKALAYAHDLHQKQTRKNNGEPYIAHLLAVASMVIEQGADEDTAIAALLHDAFEDQWWERRYGIDAKGKALVFNLEVDVADKFGQRVVDIVNELTEERFTPGAEKPKWRDRKMKYLDHIEKASPEALLIAAADKLHNARCTLKDVAVHGDEAWDKFNMGRSSQEWWYLAVLAVLQRRLGNEHYLVLELQSVLDILFFDPTRKPERA